MAMRIKGSIGSRIFAAFIAMSLVTAALGAFGLYVLSVAGGYVAGTFDGPLMAVNYARSASLQFVEMDKEILRRSLVAEADRPGIDKRLDDLTSAFFDDLAVANDRSLAEDERTVIREIKQLVTQWSDLRRSRSGTGLDRNLDAIAEKVINRFDALTELTVDHSFVARRKALSTVADFRNSSLAAIAVALLLSAAITLMLARRIVRPLSAAASVADRIAGGELQTPIPAGGEDETGALLRSMTVMQDNIRDMMERETALRRSAQGRLIAALESSPEAMVLVDAHGRAVITNSQLTAFFPPLARQLGADANFAAVFRDVASRLVTRIVIQGGSRVPEHLPDWSDLLAVGGEFQLADGKWLRASRGSTPEGGYFLVLSDITEMKEREANLAEAKRQAEAASEAKSHFLTNMSHELRTPLNAIIGFGELMSSQTFGKLGDPRYVDYAANVLTSARHLLDIINSVLDLARTASGRLHLEPTSVDLGAVFSQCAAMMTDQCARADLDLVVSVPDPPPVVWADAAKLRQIILNLLSNAVKFSEAGGRIALIASARSGGTEVKIMDSGIGMSPDHVAIALTPFSQVDNRLARRYEGTGLGLPLTKALVELHGSQLDIASKLGDGTTVSFILRSPDAAAPTVREEPASAQKLPG
jgi:signal transduction histidine kinase